MSVVLPIDPDSRFRSTTCVGGETSFSVPFPFQDNADITVERVDTAGVTHTLAETADYALTGAGEAAGGTVTLVVAAVAGEKILRIGQAVLERTSSIVASGRFASALTDAELDRNRIIQQEQARDIGRAWKAALGQEGGLIDASGARGQMVTFDGVGNLVPGNAGSVDLAVPGDGTVDDAKIKENSALYGRVADSVNLLDYATSAAQRLSVKRGDIAFNALWSDAVADAQSRGINKLYLPSGTFQLDTDLSVANPGFVICGDPGGGTIIGKNGTGFGFVTQSTPPSISDAPALTADVAAGDTSCTLSTSDAAQFAAGQTAIIRSANESIDACPDAEFVYIIGVNGSTGTITFASPVHFAYATDDTAKLIPVTLTAGIGYRDLIVDWTNGTQTSPQRPPYNVDQVFVAWFCDRPYFYNVASKKTFDATISLHCTMDARVLGLRGKDGYSDGTDLDNAFSYGIEENGLCVGTMASNLQFERHRHGYTTGSPDSADTTMFDGGQPMYSVISNGIHRNAKEAGWDTHGPGVGITWSNLHTRGGHSSGFQVRSGGLELVGCSARDILAGPGSAPPGHGLYLVNGGSGSGLFARDNKINGFTAINCAGAGIQDQSAGDLVIGGKIHIEGTNEPGVVADGSATGTLRLGGHVFMKDVAKNPSFSLKYAIAIGNANLPFSSISNVQVDDPNDNLTSIIRRVDATTALDIDNVRGRNSTGSAIRVF